jgi:hypothetical protein
MSKFFRSKNEEKEFKEYGELKKRLEYVVGSTGTTSTVEDQIESEDDSNQTTLSEQNESENTTSEVEKTEDVGDPNSFFKDM